MPEFKAAKNQVPECDGGQREGPFDPDDQLLPYEPPLRLPAQINGTRTIINPDDVFIMIV